MSASGTGFDGSDSPTDVPATIFVSDPSVEADRLSTSLRSRGYTVIDVPLSLLLARVAVQIPSIILLDVDADGALDIAARLREIPGGQSVDVLFFGNAPPEEQAAPSDASGFLVRPVEVAALLDRVAALVRARRESGPISNPESGAPSTPSARSLSMRSSGPPSSSRISAVPPSRGGFAGPPSSPRRPSLPEPRRSFAPPMPPVDVGLAAATGEGAALPLPSLSPEVEGLLRAAEERSRQEPGSTGRRGRPAPSPEDEVDAVLPAELLEALDEPLDESDDFDGDSALTTGLARRPVGAAHASAASPPAGATEPPSGEPPSGEPPSFASPSSAHPDTPVHAFSGPSDPPTPPPEETTAPEDPKQLETPRPPRPKPRDRETVPPPFWRGTRSPSRTASQRPPPSSPPERAPRDEARRPSDAPPDAAPLELPDVVRPGVALHAFATCVKSRSTGALCIEIPSGIRRILVRDGDVVTAASGLDDESLVAFLETRGDLSHDVATQLRARIPAFGRHAGAALVANGQISQDQLWPVLRAHAEWILGRTISTESGTASFEVSPPPRLKTEPSVFGGATGAEVLIEVVRRTVPASVALERLGGEGARIIDGPRTDLFAECALDAGEVDVLDRLKGATLAELADSPDQLAPTVYALVALAVLDIEKEKVKSTAARPGATFDRWDEDALRAQVKTRLSLVREADYFTLLGVASSATAYEIHRAYLELRRTLEPARVLSAATADLADDLLLIIDVLEEAHDVLRDQVRRERYRRAIEAKPPS